LGTRYTFPHTRFVRRTWHAAMQAVFAMCGAPHPAPASETTPRPRSARHLATKHPSPPSTPIPPPPFPSSFGIRGLVIDPYNELDHQRPPGVSETEYVSQMLTKIKRFAQHYDAHVWFVAHPRQLQQWRGDPPNLYDISGSAHFVNKADNGVVVHRVRDEGAAEASAAGKQVNDKVRGERVLFSFPPLHRGCCWGRAGHAALLRLLLLGGGRAGEENAQKRRGGLAPPTLSPPPPSPSPSPRFKSSCAKCATSRPGPLVSGGWPSFDIEKLGDAGGRVGGRPLGGRPPLSPPHSKNSTPSSPLSLSPQARPFSSTTAPRAATTTWSRGSGLRGGRPTQRAET